MLTRTQWTPYNPGRVHFHQGSGRSCTYIYTSPTLHRWNPKRDLRVKLTLVRTVHEFTRGKISIMSVSRELHNFVSNSKRMPSPLLSKMAHSKWFELGNDPTGRLTTIKGTKEETHGNETILKTTQCVPIEKYTWPPDVQIVNRRSLYSFVFCST